MFIFCTVASILSAAAAALPPLGLFSDPLDLAAELADIDYFDGFGYGVDPAACCLPKQWQGMVDTLTGVSGGRRDLYGREGVARRGGKGKAMASTTMLYVDQTNKRVAGKVIFPVSKKEFYSFVLTFKTGNESGATLNVFNTTAQKCETKILRTAVFKDQCIPKDAKFIGSFKIGASVGGMDVNSFVYNVSDKDSAMFGNSLVTPDACLPVISHAVGNVGGRIAGLKLFEVDESEETRPRPSLGYVSSSFFYDLQASISDPSVFKPPSYCPSEEALKAENSLRFRTFF